MEKGRQPTITIYTQVYNTKPFLVKCVESVLRQTFTDFEYILIDNGSTDGCKEMLEQYAAQDNRIRLVRFEENQGTSIGLDVSRKTGAGKYFAVLDSDDWLEPTFFEHMILLAEQKHLDIVCTGSSIHKEGHGDIPFSSRSVSQQIVIEKEQYADYFPCYHIFSRTLWGKLIRRKVFIEADLYIISREKITNGTDTLAVFAWLRKAERICIDNSVLHHYLVRRESVSRVYYPSRFRSNIILYQDAVDFLSQYGPINKENARFLHRVYANAIYDTLGVLGNSDLSANEKLAQYYAIATYPATREAYQEMHPEIDLSRSRLIQQFLVTVERVENAPEYLSAILQMLLPRCGQAVTDGNITLFMREHALMEALLQDDPDKLAKGLLELIQVKRYTKQYDLGAMLHALAQEKPLLRGITNVGFLRKIHEIYWLIWKDQTLEALDAMTGLLFENRVLSAEEEFLQLYLSAAALLGQIPAFLFGKVKLAQFYLRQRRREECQTILSELETMGVEENEELSDIRRQLAALDEQ